MNELENPKVKSKKRYNESKRSLQQRITELRIENEVIKKQLVAIRNMLNDIINSEENQEVKEKK